MSGVSRFVKGEYAAPPLTGSNRVDIGTAQGLKFGAGKKNAAQYLPSTAPAPGYTSNAAPQRNTFPNTRYEAYSKGFDEVTVTSDFDHTKSDLDLESEDNENDPYMQEVEELTEYGYPAPAEKRGFSNAPHKLHHVQSRQPLIVNPEFEQNTPKPQRSGNHTRFQNSPPPPQRMELQLRSAQPANGNNHQMPASKKRQRADERPHGVHEEQPDQSDEDNQNIDEPRLTPVGANVKRDRYDSDSDGGETHIAEDNVQNESPSRQRKGRQVQSSQTMGGETFPFPDYTREQLKSMKYTDLKAEDWDTIPNAKPFELAPQLQGRSIGEQVEHYAHQKEEQQLIDFYEHLSTSEWEQAGDWLIDKFADLLKQMKQKKQEKRELTEKFEAEIEAREKAVRGKSDLLDKMFDEMKASGEGVLRGKIV